MCGFIGIISRASDTQKAFDDGLATIKTRGVSTDVLKTSGEQYGYVRLPTDDVNNVSIGLINRGDTKLLFNGLITNVDDLVRINNLNDQFRYSDAICLQAGLTKFGSKFLSHVRGMFAAAFVTDTHIMLIRDTIGIKPLYYVHQDGVFAFASEIKALCPLGKTIHEVLPGSLVIFNKSSQALRTQRFAYENYKHYDSSRLEVCLRESVVGPTKRYLRNSKKPIALLLSGGVDSSINVKMLSDSLNEDERSRVIAFCIGEDNAPDVLTTKRLAESIHVKLIHVRPYSPETAISILPKIVYKTESPHSRVIKVALLYNALAEEIKKHDIDVVLGGEGADELFYGYHRFIDGLTHKQSQELFSLFYSRIFHYTLLQRYDRVMANHQIEGRVPYLDQELIELAAAIPTENKIKHIAGGHISKIPIRDVARNIGLPPYIYNRGKEKMTAGATGRENSTARSGYLEQEAVDITGKTFQQLVTEYYQQTFGNLLALRDDHYTEEQAMELVAKYKTANLEKSKQVVRV